MAPIRPIQWTSQPQNPVGIALEKSITKGLVFCAPLSPASGLIDLVQKQRATKIGMASLRPARNGMYYSFGTGNYLSFPSIPKGLTPTTPTTVAWTQLPVATAGYSTILHINVGTPGVTDSVVIFQSTTDSGYYFTAGPRTAGGAQSWSPAIGPLTNGVFDKFVLVAAGGLNSTTSTNWNLYRNGNLVARTLPNSFSANSDGVFTIGVNEGPANPFEGVIGNLHIWNRALLEAEIKEWSANEFITLAPTDKLYLNASSGNITTTRTETGVARIQKSVNQTETGVSRIQKSVNATETGVSRIRKVVNQTETGIARIQKSVNQTETGVSRIQKSVNQTETGITRIQKVVNQTITGVSNISSGNITTTRTITGVSRIQATTTRTESGVSRIQKSVNQTESGVSRIQKVVTATETGVSRIQKSVNATETGVSRIQKSVNQTITGVARISSGGLITTPLTQYNVEIGAGISRSITPVGNMLEIEIVTSAPTDPPVNGKGVVFLVSGGVVTIYVWSGSAWIAK